VDIKDALHLVQGRMSQISSSLPTGVKFYINRLTFSAFPMIGFSVTSPKRGLAELYDLSYYQLAPRLYRLPGVAEARIVGGRAPEVHVIVEPDKLNAYGMPLTKVVDALRNNNVISPSGMVQENYHLYLTTITGLLRQTEQIENTVVDVVKGTPVLVKNVATVAPGERPAYNIVTADGRPAVLVNINQQPDGNAVEIANAVNHELEEIRKTLPPDIELKTFYDQSILVRDSIGSVTESIVIGLALSIAVLLLFLRDWRTTMIAAVVIPVAAAIAIVAMYLFHMSFNLMTLGGIAACIGVVIDDAIVMVENITVHLSIGQSPSEAAGSAIRELTPALIGSTLTPIVVFVPLVFLGGITAVFFRALGGMVDGFTERARRVGLLLTDPGTTFLIVTAPRHDPVEEAIFFHRKLRDADMPFGGLVVNRLHRAVGNGALPDGLDEELAHKVEVAAHELAALAERDAANVEHLRSELGDPPTIVVPELDGDVHDVEGLALMRGHLFADG